MVGRIFGVCVLLLFGFAGTAGASPGSELRSAVAARAVALEPRLIARRREFHGRPELGNRETWTAGVIAAQLRELGLEVRVGVAGTGVVAVLKGKLPGRVVALRSDMDGLPVKEASTLPFASRARGVFRGQEVDVMHACGHDGHMAILLTVAELLSGLRDKLPGTVVFYFQPAEEGPSDFVPDGKKFWGARLMVQQGVLKSPRPEAVFGLHLWAGIPTGRIAYRAGPTMASSDDLSIRVIGKQTHAGRPWDGIDPIVVSAQVIMGLQTVVSRQTDLTSTPTIVSLGTIHGGTRYNIIPDFVELEGTVRSYDEALRRSTHEKIIRTAEHIAAASGAKAEVRLIDKYNVTINDPALTERSVPSLRWAANDDVVAAPLGGGAEDFSFLAKEVPGFFFFLGASTRTGDPTKAAPNHSPSFTIDESTLRTGVRALSVLATDYLTQ